MASAPALSPCLDPDLPHHPCVFENVHSRTKVSDKFNRASSRLAGDACDLLADPQSIEIIGPCLHHFLSTL
jgi:hypothetical protein